MRINFDAYILIDYPNNSRPYANMSLENFFETRSVVNANENCDLVAMLGRAQQDLEAVKLRAMHATTILQLAKRRKEHLRIIPICIYLTNKYIENVDTLIKDNLYVFHANNFPDDLGYTPSMNDDIIEFLKRGINALSVSCEYQRQNDGFHYRFRFTLNH